MTSMAKVGRNDPCPCGSGKKYKKCCLTKDEAARIVRIGAKTTMTPPGIAESDRDEEYDMIPTSLKEMNEMITAMPWVRHQHQVIARQMSEHLKDRYRWEEITTAILLWYSYSREQDPLFQKHGVIFAALEYSLGLITGKEEVTQAEVAKRYGVSAGSVSNRMGGLYPYLDKVIAAMIGDAEDDDYDDEEYRYADADMDDNPMMSPGMTAFSPAQELIDKAAQATSDKQRRKWAEQAIELDPLHPDGYNQLADSCSDLKEATQWYRRGVQAGRSRLGQAFFTENRGHFWLMPETRPFMRSMFGYAENCLHVLGRPKEAAAVLEEMLELCPSDNLGARYVLVLAYLLQKKYTLARKLIQHYDEDSASFNYSLVYIAYKQNGIGPALKAYFARAVSQNPFVVPFLTGKRRLPNHSPAYIGFGDESEAAEYAIYYFHLFQSEPKLVSWMDAEQKKLKQV